MKTKISILFVLICTCTFFLSCKSSQPKVETTYVVGVWEYKDTKIDLNTILPFDGVVEKAFAIFSGIGNQFSLIKGDIEFTRDGKFIANKVKCNYTHKENVVKLDQSLLEASKVNTSFTVVNNGDELHLIYDAKQTAKPFLSGVQGLALSAIKKGDIILVFKKKR